MLSLVSLYVFNFGLLVFMSCVNYIIEKKELTQICFGDDIYLLSRIVYLGGSFSITSQATQTF